MTKRQTRRCKECNKVHKGQHCPTCVGRACKQCGEVFKPKPYQRTCGKCVNPELWQRGFLQWLLRTFQRCPYKESITDSGMSGFLRLLGKYKLAVGARGYYRINDDGVKVQYELDLCHLYPASADYITPLAASNIVVGDSRVNRSAKGREYGYSSTGILKAQGTEVVGRSNQIKFLIKVFEIPKAMKLPQVNLRITTRSSSEEFYQYPNDKLALALRDAGCTAQNRMLNVDLYDGLKIYRHWEGGEWYRQEQPYNDEEVKRVTKDVLENRVSECNAWDYLVNYKYEPIRQIEDKRGRERWIDSNDHAGLGMALSVLHRQV